MTLSPSKVFDVSEEGVVRLFITYHCYVKQLPIFLVRLLLSYESQSAGGAALAQQTERHSA